MHPSLNLPQGTRRGARRVRGACALRYTLPAIAALACATPAWADVLVQAYAGTLNLQVGGTVSAPFSASKQATKNTAFEAADSFASADLNTGTLRAAFTGTSFQLYSNLLGSATAVMSDDIVFHGPNSTVAVSFYLHVDGTFAMAGGASPGNITMDGTLNIDADSSMLTLSRVFGPGVDILTGSVTGSPGSFLNKTLNSADALMVVTTTVHTEVPIAFYAQIGVADRGAPVGMTATADFSHTAQAAVVMPAGYSFTSASGHFLTTPVPEPASGVLMLAGCAGLAWMRRTTLRLA